MNVLIVLEILMVTQAQHGMFVVWEIQKNNTLVRNPGVLVGNIWSVSSAAETCEWLFMI